MSAIQGQTLALSGGGVKGALEVQLCVFFEGEEGKNAPLAKIFDVMGGTSIGSFLAAGFLVPDPNRPGQPLYSAKWMQEQFPSMAQQIFANTVRHEVSTLDGLYKNKYDSAGIEKVLKTCCGDVKISQLMNDFIIPVVRFDNAQKKMSLFHITKDAPGWGEQKTADVGRATTAAPTYFSSPTLTTNGETHNYFDGGFMRNNPTSAAVMRCANQFGCGSNQIVVSLGTGSTPINLKESVIESGGDLGWAEPSFETLFAGQDEVSDFDTQAFLNGHGSYLRVQMDIPNSLSALDKPANIPQLNAIADDWIAQNHQTLLDFCDKLKVRDNDVFSSPSTSALVPVPVQQSALGSSPSSGWSLPNPIRWLRGGYT